MPIRDGGAVLGVCVVLVSIQHLKEAQEAIAARERQLALITDTIGFPVTYFDRDRIVRFANAQSAEWAGRTPAQMVGPLPRGDGAAGDRWPTAGRCSTARSPGSRSPTSARRSGPAASRAASAAT